MRRPAIALFLLLAAGAAAQQAASPDARALTPFERPDVTAVAEQLACYCGCPHMQVSTCFCGTADSIRQSIADDLDAGMTPQQIVDAYVAEHGTWGLAVPPKEGFNLIVWALPAALISLGAVFVFVLGAKLTAGAGTGGRDEQGLPEPAIDDEQRERLERLLEED